MKYINEEEINVIYRGTNHKSHKSPKNTDIRTYKMATGFEALIGYLYINNKSERINDIINYILSDES